MRALLIDPVKQTVSEILAADIMTVLRMVGCAMQRVAVLVETGDKLYADANRRIDNLPPVAGFILDGAATNPIAGAGLVVGADGGNARIGVTDLTALIHFAWCRAWGGEIGLYRSEADALAQLDKPSKQMLA